MDIKKINGWQEWGKFVLKELERFNDNYEKLDRRVTDIQVKLAKLEIKFNIKSGIWGLIAGMIPATVVLIWWILKR